MNISDLPKSIIVNKYSGETAVLILNGDCLGYYRNTNKSSRKDEVYMIDEDPRNPLSVKFYNEEEAVKELYSKLTALKFV